MKVIKLNEQKINEQKLNENSVTYPHVVQNRGGRLVDESEYDESMNKKKDYFENYLTPATRAARCGWYDVKLVVYEFGSEENGKYRTSYMAMCGDEQFKLSSCKLINVEGNSLGACLEELGANIF